MKLPESRSENLHVDIKTMRVSPISNWIAISKCPL